MKNNLFLLIAVLCIISCTKDENYDKIVGTWGLYQEINHGTVIVVDYTNPNEQITYRSDGTWRIDSYGLLIQGTWKNINTDVYEFSTFGGGFITGAEIEFINADEHILKISENDWRYFRRI